MIINTKKPSKNYTCFILRHFETKRLCDACIVFEGFFSVDETVKSIPVVRISSLAIKNDPQASKTVCLVKVWISRFYVVSMLLLSVRNLL